MRRLLVQRGRYFDSVFLLRISRTLEEVPGVTRAVVAMGTLANLENLARVGFDVSELGIAAGEALPQAGSQTTLRAHDLVIGLEAGDEQAVQAAEDRLAELLAAGTARGAAAEESPSTLGDALAIDSAANLALISVPGGYAAAEARRALRRGLHVMLFSDNVSVEDEISLKEDAARRGLLVMGPDCGTAIVNGVALGFANVVRRGPIGVVGASGTGIQEITSLVDRMGGGISHALGTGGRDLSDVVAARSTLAAIAALSADSDTAVVVVVSKAPAPGVAERVLAELAASGKPCVVHFVGTSGGPPRGAVTFADNLAAAARAACRLAGVAVREDSEAGLPKAHFQAPGPRQPTRLRGFFCGGTLAQEAWSILRRHDVPVRSNVAADKGYRIAAGEKTDGHVLWDLGDDAFTVGRPHPMIEPALRDREVERALTEPEVGVVLADCVLGYGAHADPAGSLARAVERAAEARRADRRAALADLGPAVVASITGTDRDPQGYRDQRRTLEAAGVYVAESNAAASEWCARLLSAGGGTEAAR